MPPELRNVIYELVVTKPDYMAWVDTKKPCEDLAVQPALLRTCSIVRKEALPIYYTRNKFIIAARDLRAATNTILWLHGLGEDGRRLVKEVFMHRRDFWFCGMELNHGSREERSLLFQLLTATRGLELCAIGAGKPEYNRFILEKLDVSMEGKHRGY